MTWTPLTRVTKTFFVAAPKVGIGSHNPKYEFRHPKYNFRHPKYELRHPKYGDKFRHPKYKFRHPRNSDDK